MTMRNARDMQARQECTGFTSDGGHATRAFTLTELVASIAIIGILLSISGLAFRRSIETSSLAQARSAIITYAAVARSYAMANHIETMFVVNPYNGRFEIWYLNPPTGGGPFDPLSAGIAPPLTDGYAFAPILDAAARLPIDGSGRPIAAVNPIDFDDTINRPTDTTLDGPDMDNLTWAAVCFDASGQLVIRTRRIATRTYTLRSGVPRSPATARNRLIDETPDLSIRSTGGVMVMGGVSGDSPITTTRGFVVSDANKMRQVLANFSINPQTLVSRWLRLTREGQFAAPPNGSNQSYAQFATTIVFNRYSGQEVTRTF
jgi:prepilin-type N-terminal cleavage/methylation domain-containing protein